VKQGSNVASNAISDGGKVKPGSIGVTPSAGFVCSADAPSKAPRR
jgi:hypothetical protein